MSNTRIVKNLSNVDLLPLYYHLKSELESELTTNGLGRTFEEVVRELTLRGLCPMGDKL